MTLKVVRTFPTSIAAASLALDAPDNLLFTASYSSDSVLSIDLASGSVVGSYTLAASPELGTGAMAYDPGNGDLYVLESTDQLQVFVATTGAPVTTLATDPGTIGLTYDPVNHYLFYGSEVVDNVTAIDGTTNSVRVEIDVGATTHGLTVGDPRGDVFVVAQTPNNNLTAIKGSSLLRVGTVALDGNLGIPRGVAYAAATNQLLIPTVVGISARVDVVSSTLTELGTIPLGPGPPYYSTYTPALSYDASDAELFVGSYFWQNLTVINVTAARSVGEVLLGLGPDSVAVDDANGLVYVSNLQSANVSVVSESTDRVMGALPVGAYPTAVALDSRDGNLYVASGETNNLSVISPMLNRTIAQIAVPNGAFGLAFDPTNRYLYVLGTTDGITAVDTLTERAVGIIPTGRNSFPIAEAFDPSAGELAVVNLVGNPSGTGNVTVIRASTDTPIASVSVGLEPDAIAFDPATGEFVVANAGTDNVTVIDGTSSTVLRSITFPRVPFRGVINELDGIAYGGAGTLWVTSSYPRGELYALNDSTFAIAGPYPVASVPQSPAVSPATGTVYLADNLASALTIFGPSVGSPAKYGVSFEESGLPAGTNWSVTLGGVLRASTGPIITFLEPNGSLPFAVGSPLGFVASPSNGAAVRRLKRALVGGRDRKATGLCSGTGVTQPWRVWSTEGQLSKCWL